MTHPDIDNGPAWPEGWALFTVDDPCGVQIQRIDAIERFPNDEAAVAYVRQRAAEGSAYHANAIGIHDRHKAGKIPVLAHLHERDIDTILAALRAWQRDLDQAKEGEFWEIASARFDPLTALEIDELCERVNCA